MKLEVQIRNTSEKVAPYRKKGIVPGVVYGKHMKDNISLWCKKNDVIKLYKQMGKSKPFDIVGDDGLNEMVLLHDFQLHPVTDVLLHVDFLVLKKGEKVETEVTLVFVGQSPAKKNNLGRVQIVKDMLHIEALPKNLPKEIEVDLSSLEELHDVIFVKDLQLPKGVISKEADDVALVTIADLENQEIEESTKETVETDIEEQETKESIAE